MRGWGAPRVVPCFQRVAGIVAIWRAGRFSQSDNRGPRKSRFAKNGPSGLPGINELQTRKGPFFANRHFGPGTDRVCEAVFSSQVLPMQRVAACRPVWDGGFDALG